MTRRARWLLRGPLIVIAVSLVALTAALAFAGAPEASPAPLPAPRRAEPIEVIDGDTWRSEDGRRWRFERGDAPPSRRSSREPWCEAALEAGRAAKARLAELTAAGAVIVDAGRSCNWGRGCADLRVGGRSVIEIGLAEGWLRPWPSCAASRCEAADRPDWCGERPE